MALTDVRSTILNIFNEVRKRQGLKTLITLSDDSDSLLLLDLFNDVIAEVADYGGQGWQELYSEIEVTASSSVKEYGIPTSAVVRNIHEIVFDDEISPMWLVTMDDIRRLNRSEGNGTAGGSPRQWAIFGTDGNGNPNFRVHPIPGANQNNKTFKVSFYAKPRLYTSSDAAEVPPFSSRMLVNGLLAAKVLEESGGKPTQQYVAYRSRFEELLRNSYARFNSDTGSNTFIKPAFGRSRGRY